MDNCFGNSFCGGAGLYPFLNKWVSTRTSISRPFASTNARESWRRATLGGSGGKFPDFHGSIVNPIVRYTQE